MRATVARAGPLAGVAISVKDLSQSVEGLKGADWVDPDDPNVIAEKELLAAAASIDAAAKKLKTLVPREEAVADEDLPFEEQILTAARYVGQAVLASLRRASARSPVPRSL